MFNAICIKSLYFIHHYFSTDLLMFKVCASPIGWTTFIIVLAKLTSVCYSRRYANGKNKTTNRELRQIPAGIRTCCHTQKGL